MKQVTTNLFDAPKKAKSKPVKSNRFGTISLLWEGNHYFPEDIKESHTKIDKPFEIQVVSYSGKWRQDTHYITEEFKDFLLSHVA